MPRSRRAHPDPTTKETDTSPGRDYPLSETNLPSSSVSELSELREQLARGRSGKAQERGDAPPQARQPASSPPPPLVTPDYKATIDAEGKISSLELTKHSIMVQFNRSTLRAIPRELLPDIAKDVQQQLERLQQDPKVKPQSLTLLDPGVYRATVRDKDGTTTPRLIVRGEIFGPIAGDTDRFSTRRSDGQTVTIRRSKDGYISYYGPAGRQIEEYQPGTTRGTHLFLDPDRDKTREALELGKAGLHIISRSIYDNDQQLAIEERFDDRGKLSSRYSSSDGAIRHFSDGKVRKIEAYDFKKFLQNAPQLTEEPGFSEELTKVARYNPTLVLSRWTGLRDLKESGGLLKTAVRALSLVQVEYLQSSLEKGVANAPDKFLVDHPRYKDGTGIDKAFRELEALRAALIEGRLTALDRQDALALARNHSENLKFALAVTRKRSDERDALDALKILDDPALRDLGQLRTEWIDFKRAKEAGLLPPQEPEGARAQLRMLIARNLYFAGKEPSETSVRTELDRLIERRSAIRELPIFRSRNVLFFAHAEGLDTRDEIDKAKREAGDLHRFGRTDMQNGIKAQQGARTSFEFVRSEITELPKDRPDQALKETERAKERILDRIRKAPAPLTLVFDGHGTPNALLLLNEETSEPRGRITAEELAEALRVRHERLGRGDNPPLAERDILVFDACFSADFTRSLYASLPAAAQPLVVGSAEYGQLGYDSSSPAGSNFLSRILGVASEKHISTFGDVMRNEFMDLNELPGGKREHRNINTNPYIVVPGPGGKPEQLGRAPRTSPSDNGLT